MHGFAYFQRHCQLSLDIETCQLLYYFRANFFDYYEYIFFIYIAAAMMTFLDII